MRNTQVVRPALMVFPGYQSVLERANVRESIHLRDGRELADKYEPLWCFSNAIVMAESWHLLSKIKKAHQFYGR